VFPALALDQGRVSAFCRGDEACVDHLEGRLRYYLGHNLGRLQQHVQLAQLHPTLGELTISRQSAGQPLKFSHISDTLFLTTVPVLSHWRKETGREDYVGELLTQMLAANLTNNTFVLVRMGDTSDRNFDLQYGCLSKARMCNDPSITLAALESQRHFGNVHKIVNLDTQFAEKRPVLVWRGVSTGSGERHQLVSRWHDRLPFLDVGFTGLVSKTEFSSFAHKIPSNWTLDTYREHLVPRLSLKDMLKYRFLLSVEGNDVASGLKWMLISRSVVFMAQPSRCTWAMEDQLLPWRHYVPLRADFEDLEEKYWWAMNHTEEVQEISRRARAFMQHFMDQETEVFLKVSLFCFQLFSPPARSAKSLFNSPPSRLTRLTA